MEPSPSPTPSQRSNPDSASLGADAAARLMRMVAIEGADPPADATAEIPDLPGYHIAGRIAEGSQGIVYRGWRMGSSFPVAIKVHRWSATGSSERSRAWRELDLWGQLRCEGVPRLLDYGLAGGCLFTASEWIDGVTLDRWPALSTMEEQSRVRLLCDLCDVVQRLHERGIIHRDLKPSNVIMTPSAKPMIVDLGIATDLRGADRTITMAGLAIGTPAFMSPEQARGDQDGASTRSDVFALGAIGYWLLTGRTPFDTSGALGTVLKRIGEDPPAPLSSLERRVSAPLARVLEKSAAARPSDRYAAAGELRDDLERWLAGDPVEASPPAIWQRLWRWMGRHPVATTAALSSMVAVFTLALTTFLALQLMYRPAGIEVDSTHRRVTITTPSGIPLRVWDTGIDNGVVFSGPARGEIGGRWLEVAVIGFDVSVEIAGAADLCVFDMGSAGPPRWSSRTGAALAPPGRAESGRFAIGFVKIADVFDEVPGDEIVATHCEAGLSPTAVRVYDLSGRVLYERWHEGRLAMGHWIRDGRTLVVAGVNSQKPLAELGVTGTRFPYVQVVAGLEPRLYEEPAWIRSPLTTGDSDVLPARWYAFFGPARIADRFDRLRLGSTDRLDRDLAMIAVRFSGSQGDLRWTVTADGHIRLISPNAAYSTTPDAPVPESLGFFTEFRPD